LFFDSDNFVVGLETAIYS